MSALEIVLRSLYNASMRYFQEPNQIEKAHEYHRLYLSLLTKKSEIMENLCLGDQTRNSIEFPMMKQISIDAIFKQPVSNQENICKTLVPEKLGNEEAKKDAEQPLKTDANASRSIATESHISMIDRETTKSQDIKTVEVAATETECGHIIRYAQAKEVYFEVTPSRNSARRISHLQSESKFNGDQTQIRATSVRNFPKNLLDQFIKFVQLEHKSLSKEYVLAFKKCRDQGTLKKFNNIMNGLYGGEPKMWFRIFLEFLKNFDIAYWEKHGCKSTDYTMKKCYAVIWEMAKTLSLIPAEFQMKLKSLAIKRTWPTLELKLHLT